MGLEFILVYGSTKMPRRRRSVRANTELNDEILSGFQNQ
jgi:hypothetical protein